MVNDLHSGVTPTPRVSPNATNDGHCDHGQVLYLSEPPWQNQIITVQSIMGIMSVLGT